MRKEIGKAVKPPIPTFRNLRSSDKTEPTHKQSAVDESTAATTKLPEGTPAFLSIKTYSVGTEESNATARMKLPKSGKGKGPVAPRPETDSAKGIAMSTKGKGRQVGPSPLSTLAREEEGGSNGGAEGFRNYKRFRRESGGTQSLFLP